MTMELDKKAMEAALEAFCASREECRDYSTALEAALLVYLKASRLGPMELVEWRYSTIHSRDYPLHQPDLVLKAIRMANWQEHRNQQVFLTLPVKLEDEPIHNGQNLWFCRALKALKREEVIKLYDSLIACSKNCLETGGDFTPLDVREHLPHIYGTQPLPAPPDDKGE